MSYDFEIQEFSYGAWLRDLLDGTQHHVVMFLDKVQDGEADEETTNEEFAVDGDWVGYDDLVDRFGEEPVARFVQRARAKAS